MKVRKHLYGWKDKSLYTDYLFYGECCYFHCVFCVFMIRIANDYTILTCSKVFQNYIVRTLTIFLGFIFNTWKVVTLSLWQSTSLCQLVSTLFTFNFKLKNRNKRVWICLVICCFYYKTSCWTTNSFTGWLNTLKCQSWFYLTNTCKIKACSCLCFNSTILTRQFNSLAIRSQKKCLFCTFRSDFGADAFLELHSIETAKKHNKTPFNAIQALFEAWNPAMPYRWIVTYFSTLKELLE